MYAVFVFGVVVAVNTVFPVTVTVVAFVPAEAGLLPLVFVHVLHVYPVPTVASIFTVSPEM